jgi:hypothetical protein
MPALNTKSVLKQIKSLERHLNGLKMMPATHVLRTAVILPLLSKALTVGCAICLLIDGGFPSEAFATSRTLLEILFTVRYITNKNTEARARRYVKYSARVRAEWMEVVKKHFPKKASALRALDESVLETAKEFKSKANWTGEHGQVKVMATEEDMVEFDQDRRGLTSEFDYDALYFWTSQHVHVTVEALDAHVSPPGEVFKVRSRRPEDKGYGKQALLVASVTLCKIFIHACRSMNEQQPRAIRELYKLIRASGRKRESRHASA